MSTEPNKPTEYWAALEPEKLEDELGERIRHYYRHLQSTGRMSLYRLQARTYFGLDLNGQWSKTAVIKAAGRNGELIKASANHFRSLLDHTLVLATNAKPAFECRPHSMDPEAIEQIPIGNALCEYYLDQKSYAQKMVDATFTMLLFSEGWVWERWDEHEGGIFATQPVIDEAEPEVPVTGPDGNPMLDPMGQPQMQPNVTGQEPVYRGDVLLDVVPPWDVVRDTTKRDPDWICIRRPMNRWHLAKVHPKNAEHIQSAPSVQAARVHEVPLFSNELETVFSDDTVYEYHFYHKPNLVLPLGRHAVWVGGKVVADGPLDDPDDGIPVKQMAPKVEPEGNTGSSRTTDLIPIQKLIDGAVSTGASNMRTWGIARIWAGKGGGFDEHDLAEAMKLLECEQKPEIIAPPNLAGPAMEYANGLIEAHAQPISGIGDVMRGNPNSNSKSGASQAMMRTIALEFNSDTQQQHQDAFAWVMTKLVKLAQKHMSVPRLIEIVGKGRSSQAIMFSGDKINRIARVAVEASNPMLSSAAGRRDAADYLLDRQAISLDQWQSIISTGRFEPVEDLARSHESLSSRENEVLRQAGQVKALVTDDHVQHVQCHLLIVNDLMLRMDPSKEPIIAAALAHIQEHIQLSQSMGPWLAQLTQQTAAPMMAPPEPNPGGGKNPEKAQSAPNDAGGEAAQLPINPATGERVQA